MYIFLTLCVMFPTKKQTGSDDISNLKVVCQECNLSMGTMNMIEYKDTYYGSLHTEKNGEASSL